MIRFTEGQKIIFFAPHADDGEFGTGLAIINALRVGCDVVEVLMTNCAYGTTRDEFKGPRLVKIRMREIERTVDVYYKHIRNRLRLIKLGFIDGFLPVNKYSLNAVVEIIKREKPDIIFAPDPIFAIDFHNDHINTGVLVYFACRMIKETKPVNLFFYYTFKGNAGISCRLSDLQILKEAILQHKSQVSRRFINIVTLYKKLSLLIGGMHGNYFADRYRLVLDLDTELRRIPKGVIDRMAQVIFQKRMPTPKGRYEPPPEVLFPELFPK
ncbi:MAG: PIG-L deacetylase family protein [Promethearchaeota archaeon]